MSAKNQLIAGTRVASTMSARTVAPTLIRADQHRRISALNGEANTVVRMKSRFHDGLPQGQY